MGFLQRKRRRSSVMKTLFSPGTLDEKYIVTEDKLGKGSFSIIFAAKCREDGNLVAVKRIITSKKALNDETIRKIDDVTTNEVKALSRVNDHPGILQLLDVYDNTDKMAVEMVIELAPDGDLAGYLNDRVRLTERESRQIVRDVARAIQYMHVNGVVHRDMKPENLLVSNVNAVEKHSGAIIRVKISDFGLAHVFPEGTDATFRRSPNDLRMTTLCGSRLYCAPEIVLKEEYNSSVDLWGLGVILYMMIIGDMPYPPTCRRRRTETLNCEQKLAHELEELHLRKEQEKYIYSAFENPLWDKVSYELKDLSRMLLAFQTSQRLTVAEIMANPWVENVNDVESNGIRRIRSQSVPSLPRMKHIPHVNEKVLNEMGIKNNNETKEENMKVKKDDLGTSIRKMITPTFGKTVRLRRKSLPDSKLKPDYVQCGMCSRLVSKSDMDLHSQICTDISALNEKRKELLQSSSTEVTQDRLKNLEGKVYEGKQSLTEEKY